MRESRQGRSSISQRLGGADPRLGRNFRAGTTDQDLGGGLQLSALSKIELKVDPPLAIDQKTGRLCMPKLGKLPKLSDQTAGRDLRSKLELPTSRTLTEEDYRDAFATLLGAFDRMSRMVEDAFGGR